MKRLSKIKNHTKGDLQMNISKFMDAKKKYLLYAIKVCVTLIYEKYSYPRCIYLNNLVINSEVPSMNSLEYINFGHKMGISVAEKLWWGNLSHKGSYNKMYKYSRNISCLRLNVGVGGLIHCLCVSFDVLIMVSCFWTRLWG